MLSFSAVLPVLQRAVKREKLTTYINGRPHTSTINTKSVSNPDDDSAARELCRSLVSSCGVPVGEILTAVLLHHLSSSSERTGVHSTWERNTDQQGMLSTSWAPPTRGWALDSARLPQLPVGKPPSLPCSVHLPPAQCLSFIPASSSLAPGSTNRCPSCCVWDCAFYRRCAHFLIPHPHHIHTVKGNATALARPPISTWLATTNKLTGSCHGISCGIPPSSSLFSKKERYSECLIRNVTRIHC